MNKLPLEWIRVVELAVAWTGPSLAQTLGDFGAEVIKVESVYSMQPASRGALKRPPREAIVSQQPITGGYPNREPGRRPWNVSPQMTPFLRNKLSMTVRDLKEPRSRELFLRLIKVSDVFIENNQAETLDKLNINYDVLKAVKPDIIVVRLPACGLSGPYRTYRTHGPNLDALAGHLSLRGYQDMGPRGASEATITDYTAPAFGVVAAMLALYHRQKTGKGQLIECPSFETMPPCLGEAMMDYFMNGRVHKSIGNRDIHGAAPCGCYRCLGEDEWVNITVASDEEWQGFKKVLGHPSWVEEDAYSNAYNRWKNQDTLDRLVEAWTMKHDKYDIMNMMQREGIAAGPVMNAADSYSDPHLKARGFFEKVSHVDAGTHLYPGIAWKLSKTPLSTRRPPVCLGEDNEYVYREILGVSDEEYAELVERGEISNEPAAHIK